MVYTPVNWTELTALSAANLANMDDGIADAFDILEASGRIVQIKYVQFFDHAATSSTSWQTIGSPVTITPLFSGNKIIVIAAGFPDGYDQTSGEARVYCTTDSSALDNAYEYAIRSYSPDGENEFLVVMMDSYTYSTIKQYSFSVQIRKDEGPYSTGWNNFGTYGTQLIAMEVAQ